MTPRRALQTGAVVVQTAVMVRVLGRVEAMTTRGEVLVVLLTLLSSALAATTRAPVWLVPMLVGGGGALVAAGRPVWQLAVLGAATVVQLAVTDAPDDVRVLPVLAAAGVGAGAATVLPLLVPATAPPAWTAGVGVAVLATTALVVLHRSRSEAE